MSDTEQLVVRDSEEGVRFDVRVTPRASRNAIVGVHAGALRVSLTAPPIEGEANAALIALIARTLSVPKRAVRILRGERGRQKTVAVDGGTCSQVSTALVEATGHGSKR